MVGAEWNDLHIAPDGAVTFLHLTRDLIPLYEAFGGKVACYPPPERPPNHLKLRESRVGIASPEELALLPEDALWQAHDGPGCAEGVTLLDLKIELARRLLNPCRLCARRCPIDRNTQQGWCHLVGEDAEIFGMIEHYGEEAPLIPSLTIYLSGCNYRCTGCQTGADFEGKLQRVRLSPEALARQIDAHYARGIWNANFLGGEPSLHLPYILRTVRACRTPVQVVWNSNMHLTREVSQLLNGVVDFYLADLKFGNDDCAYNVAKIRPYWEVVTQAIESAVSQPAEIIVRTLPLPGHDVCCQRPIENYLGALGVRVSRQHYTPMYKDAQ